MLALTQETVDDNATVRVITIFSLIYLPASFVAVSPKSVPLSVFTLRRLLSLVFASLF